MKAIEFYKWINENQIEWKFISNDEMNDALIFPTLQQLIELNKLLPYSFFDEEGIKITWKGDYVCINASYILEHFDIDISEIFNK